MQWKQFLTPVRSIDWRQAEGLINTHGLDEITFLDVRQPSEYEAGHLPGAVLVPLGELDKRLAELDKGKPLVVY
jgi:rhodanese-related sulfurtransferase